MHCYNYVIIGFINKVLILMLSNMCNYMCNNMCNYMCIYLRYVINSKRFKGRIETLKFIESRSLNYVSLSLKIKNIFVCI